MNNIYRHRKNIITNYEFYIKDVDNVKLKLCYNNITCTNIKNLELIKSKNIHSYNTCYLSLKNINNFNNKLSSNYIIKNSFNENTDFINYKISLRYYYNNKNIKYFCSENKFLKKFIIDSVMDIMK